MAAILTTYADRRGKPHRTAEDATLSDIAALFGGAANGVAMGVARTILNNRDELQAILAEHDAMSPRDTQVGV